MCFLVAGQGDRDPGFLAALHVVGGDGDENGEGRAGRAGAEGRDGFCSGEAPNGRALSPQLPVVSEGRFLAGLGDGGDVTVPVRG